MVKQLSVTEAVSVSAAEVNVGVLSGEKGARNFSAAQGQQMQRSGSDGAVPPEGDSSAPQSRCWRGISDCLLCCWGCIYTDCIEDWLC
jgi:hypothetical protein